MIKPLQGKHRIEVLTDGVYAVAVTLLVLELRLPETGPATTDADLQNQLPAIVPKLLSWLISFVFLSLLWISVHRLFHRMRGIDARFMLLTFWQIALLRIAPFVVATMARTSSSRPRRFSITSCWRRLPSISFI